MKSQISMNKGTQSVQMEISLPNWSGDSFKKFQEGRFVTLSANAIMLTKRGTTGIRSSLYPKSRYTPIPAGYRINSARGTAIRTL